MLGNKRGQNHLKREVVLQLLRELITLKSCCQEGGFQCRNLIPEHVRKEGGRGEEEE